MVHQSKHKVKNFKKLLALCQEQENIIIQTHDFPDYDAIASAFALQKLLQQEDIPSYIVYGGDIQSDSLCYTIKKLEIDVVSIDSLKNVDQGKDNPSNTEYKVILVDGHINNNNITKINGETFAVIDHHETSDFNIAKYVNIEPKLGACSTLIYEYYKSGAYEIDKNTATLLLMGIMMDTNSLTRGVSYRDLEAFSSLFVIGDWKTGNYLLNNSLSIKDIPDIIKTLDTCRISDDFCFASLKKRCQPDMMGILADYFIRFREIHTVVLITGDDQSGYRCSVRNENKSRSANNLIKKALEDIGSGGGHAHMAGGFITTSSYPGIENLYKRFYANITSTSTGAPCE